MSSNKMIIVLATLLAYICIANAYSSDHLRCPEECDCHLFRVNWVTDCSESNLTALPNEGLDTEVYKLNMNGNLLREVNPFPANIKLRTLQLSGNILTKIEETTFAGLTYLVDIDLSSNLINYIDPKSFENNAGLITLELQRNPLKQVRGPFLHSKFLLNLYLGNCQLTTLTPQFFSNIRNLNKLDLSGNPLRRLEAGVFDPLTSLKHLILNNCELTYISSDALTNLARLTRLELAVNNFQRIEWIPILSYLTRLEHLDLRRSGVYNLPKDAFLYNTWLRTLVLAENQLYDLDLSLTFGHKLNNLDLLDLGYCNLKGPLLGAFANANKLRTLVLSGNQLSTADVAVAISPLSKLVKLSLKSCGLTQLPVNMFHNSTDLKELDISRNPLNNVFEALLSPLQSLEHLDMGYSNLKKLSRTTFFRNPALKTLILSGNKFQRFESGLFQNLSHLEVLELNNCDLSHLDDTVFYENMAYPKLEELRLSGNPIQFPEKGSLLPPQLSSLKRLDLSKCNLNYLPEDAFKTTPGIDQLMLNDNILTNDKDDSMNFLKTLAALELLDLSYNNMTEIKPYSFSNNYLIMTLKLVGNPWKCDCYVAEMWNWATKPIGSIEVLVGYRRLLVDDTNMKRLVCQFHPQSSPVKETFMKRQESKISWAKYFRNAHCPHVVHAPRQVREVHEEEKSKKRINWIPYGFYGVIIGTLIVQHFLQ